MTLFQKHIFPIYIFLFCIVVVLFFHAFAIDNSEVVDQLNINTRNIDILIARENATLENNKTVVSAINEALGYERITIKDVQNDQE